MNLKLPFVLLTVSLFAACSNEMESEMEEEMDQTMVTDTTDQTTDNTDQTTDDTDNMMTDMQYECGQSDHPKVGSLAILSTLHHMVAGDVTITDNCTLTVSNFTYDGEGPSVYFYGGIESMFSSENGGFAIGPQLNGTIYSNDSFTITLTDASLLDKMDSVSVWCADFAVSFGDGQFN